MEPEKKIENLKSYKITLPNYHSIIKANKLQMISETGQTAFFRNRDTVAIVPKEAFIEQVSEIVRITNYENENGNKH